MPTVYTDNAIAAPTIYINSGTTSSPVLTPVQATGWQLVSTTATLTSNKKYTCDSRTYQCHASAPIHKEASQIPPGFIPIRNWWTNTDFYLSSNTLINIFISVSLISIKSFVKLMAAQSV